MADSTIKDLIAELKSGNAGARKQEKTELGKQTSQLAMLKKEIENQGGKAENNEKYNREQLKIQQGELKLSKSNTGYFSKARKQLNEELIDQKTFNQYEKAINTTPGGGTFFMIARSLGVHI